MNLLDTVSLQDVKSEPVRWLWPGRIAASKVTLLCGDPGLGKSFITMDLAARISAGLPMPDGASGLRRPADVLVFSAEDDPGDTIRPRIEAAGGDCSRIRFVRGVSDDRSQGHVALDADVPAIELAVSAMERCRLIIIDPISAYMGQADSNNNAEVRSVLARLSRLAMEAGAAIVCVTHLNKSGAGKAVYRAMGSLAFTAAARMAWQVSRCPGGDDDLRVMTLIKSNLECKQTGLSFRIDGGRVAWMDTDLRLTADEADSAGEGEDAGAVQEAVEFLLAALGEHPRPTQEILSEAATLNIAERTLRRARRLLGVKVKQIERQWVMVLAKRAA